MQIIGGKLVKMKYFHYYIFKDIFNNILLNNTQKMLGARTNRDTNECSYWNLIDLKTELAL